MVLIVDQNENTYTHFVFVWTVVSSKMEFLSHKKPVWILFYAEHTGYTIVDRRLMRHFIRYN